VTHARGAHGLSERRACAIIGVDRSTTRYQHRRVDDVATRMRLKELAAARRRFGWRRLKLLLERASGSHASWTRSSPAALPSRCSVSATMALS
jgi:hypothetical protein